MISFFDKYNINNKKIMRTLSGLPQFQGQATPRTLKFPFFAVADSFF